MLNDKVVSIDDLNFLHRFIHFTSGKWLEQTSQWHEMYCHDLEVMSLNPGRVELGMHASSTSVLSPTWTKLHLYREQPG